MLPLVLLPGMMCDARMFFPQIAALSGQRAIMAAPMVGADTMAALADQVLAVAPKRFALAGLSMGGILAMEVLRQAPDRVARLALLDTNPRAELEAVKARRTPQMEAVAQGALRAVMRDEMKPNYLVESPRKQDILDLCMDMALGLGARVFRDQSIALRDRIDQQDTLRAYRGKALVLCGRHDVLCPVERHELMHELLQDSTLEIIEGAGHLPTLEQPEHTTAALIRWLED
jgi:pimeloyl-ACP methyl ester carboxylesterase